MVILGRRLTFSDFFNNHYAPLHKYLKLYLSVCGGVLHYASGFIRSPNYPNPYRHNAVCTWIIHVEDGNTIIATITDLAIESSTGCRYDNVELRDGTNSSARLIKRLCGTQLPTVTFKSSGSYMFVQFKSDQSVGGRGFELKYTSGKILSFLLVPTFTPGILVQTVKTTRAESISRKVFFIRLICQRL